jgi:hypothetical protein
MTLTRKGWSMDIAIEKAIAVFFANPDGDWTVIGAALQVAGYTPRQAWELFQFLPIAYVHVAFAPQGVVFTPTYLLAHGHPSNRTTHRFVDEPIYVQGVAAAEQYLSEGHSAWELRPGFHNSAEYSAILKLLNTGSEMENIRLTEPLLMEYEE